MMKTKKIKKKIFLRKNIVIIGGGGGASSLLSTLKNLVYDKKISSLTSLITNADDGGSTGKIRKWYNTSAWGDITKNILALVDNRKVHLQFLTEALKCRFNYGDFKGHTLRNILLTGISQLNNCNDDCAIQEIKYILGIDKNLIVTPITSVPVNLKFTSKIPFKIHGNKRKVKVLIGQKKISVDLPIQNITNNIDDYDISVFSEKKKVLLHKNARNALEKSDCIIISPGHTHGSILAALCTPNLHKYIKNKKLLYIIPFFNRTALYQTNRWNCSDYIKIYNKYLKRDPDYVIINNKYNIRVRGHKWVKNDIRKNNIMQYKLISTNLVAKSKIKKSNCPKTKTDTL